MIIKMKMTFRSDTNYDSIDPFDTAGFFDHSLGSNLTSNGAGIESTSNADLLTNMALYSVAQQSSNLGFGYSLDPDLSGNYSFRFDVLEKGTQTVLSSAEIQVQVPEPSTLPLMLGALGILAFAAYRRGRQF